jgi:hypothetical protein
MKRRKAPKTYADYLREQLSRLSDFEREKEVLKGETVLYPVRY